MANVKDAERDAKQDGPSAVPPKPAATAADRAPNPPPKPANAPRFSEAADESLLAGDSESSELETAVEDAVLLQISEAEAEAEADGAEADAEHEVDADAEHEAAHEQEIMVDAEGQPVLPTSAPLDLNAEMEPMMTVPAGPSPVAPSMAGEEAAPAADAFSFRATDEESSGEAEEADAEDEADADAESDSEEEFGAVAPVEQAEIPTEFPAFRQEFDAAAEEEASESSAEAEAAAEEERVVTFRPLETASARRARLPVEPEMIG